MESEWESHKETIRRLYLEEDKTRCEVMRAMENKFDFRAEAGKYERQFRKWNFRKNLNEKEWRAVVRRINKRKAQGKESQLRIDGILVTAKKLKKATARYQDSKLDTIKRSMAIDRRSRTPDGLTIRTPPSFEVHCTILENLPWFTFLQDIKDEILAFRRLIVPLNHRPEAMKFSTTDPDLYFLNDIVATIGSWKGDAVIPASANSDQEPLFEDRSTISSEVDFIESLMERILLSSNRMVPTKPLFISSAKSTVDALCSKVISKAFKSSAVVPLVTRLLAKTSPTVEALVETIFKSALHQDDVDLVRVLLTKSKISCNDALAAPWYLPCDRYPPFGGRKPLDVAISHRNLDMVELLLEFGVKHDSTALASKVNSWNITPESFENFITCWAPQWYDQWAETSRNITEFETAPGLLEEKSSCCCQSCSGGTNQESERASDLNHDQTDMASSASGNLAHKHRATAGGTRHGKESPMSVLDFVKSNDSHGLSSALAQGADPNFRHGASGCSALSKSVEAGSMELVEILLDAGAQQQLRGSQTKLEDTPLLLAIQSRHLNMVKFLLSRGADPNTCSADLRLVSALQLATFYKLKAVVACLLDYGADTDLCHVSPSTPLQTAVNHGDVDLVSLLLSGGANVNTTSGGITPLQIAVDGRDLRMVSLLLEKGAMDGPTICYPALFKYPILKAPRTALHFPVGSTALILAAQHPGNSNLEIVKELVSRGADVNAHPSYPCFDSALTAAVEQGNDLVAEFLLENGALPRVSLKDPHADLAASVVHVAVRKGNYHILQRAIQCGADVNTLDNSRLSPLIYAIKLCLPWREVQRFLLLLIGHGADPNHPGAAMTALQAVATFKSLDTGLIEYFLRLGAHVDNISLRSAVRFGHHAQVAKMLRIAFSSPDGFGGKVDSCFGHTALFQAAIKNDNRMIGVLIHGGIKVSSPCVFRVIRRLSYDGNLTALGLLLEHGAPSHLSKALKERESHCSARLAINWHDRNVWQGDLLFEAGSPLQFAAHQDHNQIAQLLLDYGASTEYTTVEGQVACQLAPAAVQSARTPLQVAARRGNAEQVKMLVNAGADVNAPPAWAYGFTALQAAGIQGQTGMARILLEAGAQVNAPGAKVGGLTALEGAAQWGRIDMLSLLLDAGADLKSDNFGARQMRNAVNLARYHGHNAAARLLLRHLENCPPLPPSRNHAKTSPSLQDLPICTRNAIVGRDKELARHAVKNQDSPEIFDWDEWSSAQLGPSSELFRAL